MAKIIGMEVAPVLADFTNVLLDSATGSGGPDRQHRGLGYDGSIRTWAQKRSHRDRLRHRRFLTA
ncbi:MAG: hypothetical protein IPH55_19780 [Betaproteobacteria bacterium]|nr:hypothetical protein [Betaproteobacteria bacterium]